MTDPDGPRVSGRKRRPVRGCNDEPVPCGQSRAPCTGAARPTEEVRCRRTSTRVRGRSTGRPGCGPPAGAADDRATRAAGRRGPAEGGQTTALPTGALAAVSGAGFAVVSGDPRYLLVCLGLAACSLLVGSLTRRLVRPGSPPARGRQPPHLHAPAGRGGRAGCRGRGTPARRPPRRIPLGRRAGRSPDRRAARAPPRRAWSRRPADQDFGAVRLGLGPVAALVGVTLPGAARPADPSGEPVGPRPSPWPRGRPPCTGCPVVLSLRAAGCVAVLGAAQTARDVLRAWTLELALTRRTVRPSAGRPGTQQRPDRQHGRVVVGPLAPAHAGGRAAGRPRPGPRRSHRRRAPAPARAPCWRWRRPGRSCWSTTTRRRACRPGRSPSGTASPTWSAAPTSSSCQVRAARSSGWSRTGPAPSAQDTTGAIRPGAIGPASCRTGSTEHRRRAPPRCSRRSCRSRVTARTTTVALASPRWPVRLRSGWARCSAPRRRLRWWRRWDGARTVRRSTWTCARRRPGVTARTACWSAPPGPASPSCCGR